MSRFYGMNLTITGYDPERVEEIRRSCADEWDFPDGDWTYHKDDDGQPVMEIYRESTLVGGETEKEFGRHMAQVIWRANQAFCLVNLRATYLEELPYESYTYDEDDYGRSKESEAEAGG